MLARLVLSAVGGVAVAGAGGAYVIHEKDTQIALNVRTINEQKGTITHLQEKQQHISVAAAQVQKADAALVAALKE